jgi:hypothetical protein
MRNCLFVFALLVCVLLAASAQAGGYPASAAFQPQFAPQVYAPPAQFNVYNNIQQAPAYGALQAPVYIPRAPVYIPRAPVFIPRAPIFRAPRLFVPRAPIHAYGAPVLAAPVYGGYGRSAAFGLNIGRGRGIGFGRGVSFGASFGAVGY